MSANSGPLASTKADSASKPSKASYDHLDINKLYKGKTSETVTKTVAQKHGMQALGKALPARRPGQVGSLKSENSTEGSNSLSGSQNSSNAVGSSHNQVHPSSNQHQPPPGWTGSGPPPQGTPSPRPAQAAPGTGQGHPQDKSWSGGSDRMGTYPSQRFAQEFPSLDSGMDVKNTSTSGNQNSGPGSSSQGPQSMAKGQDNQYGPGPILRPQTEGSWIQGGGRGMGRPGPGEFAALNPPSGGFQGPDRGNMGGPTPPPMSLGQGGPNAQQMPGYAVPQFRGIMPPNHFMFANGPPPGPGVFYPGMPRFSGMPVPPAPPRSQMNNNHNSDSSRDRDRDRDQQNRGGGRGPPAQRPSSHFANNPIIKDADLKRMDEIGVQDGGWASVQDDVDYSKTISFGSDEEEGKGDTVPSIKIISKTSISKNVNSRTDVRRDDRDSNRNEEEQMTKLDRIPERRPRILERQQSNNANNDREVEDRRQRDANDRDNRDRGGQRQDSGANKDNRGPNAHKYEQEEERKSGPPQGFPPAQQHTGFRRPPYEDKNRDPREDRRINTERGGRRPNDRRDDTGDNWRSGPPRQQQYDDERKGSQPRNEARNPDPREFAGKPHMNNLPPRLQRQQYQTNNNPANPLTSPHQAGTNQRQTPSPVAITGKEKDATRGEWEPDQEKQNQDRRRIETDYSRGKREGGRERRNYDYENRYGNDQHRDSRNYKENEAPSQSPPNRSMDSGPNSKSSDAESPEARKFEDSKPYVTSKSKMSWADEMDDDECHSSKEIEDLQTRKSKQGQNVRVTQQFSKPDYYTQQSEERQKRVIIAKHQTKVADMQSEKIEPPKEVKQQTPPAVAQAETKKPEDQPEKEKVKPVSAWGDRESRDRVLKSDKESSATHGGPDRQRDGGDREDRRSAEKDSAALQKSSSSSSVPGRNTGDSGNLPSVLSDEASTMEHARHGGRYNAHRVESEVHSNPRSGSVSDFSDRDHLERDSQDNRSKRGSNYKPTNQDRSHNVGNDSIDKQKHRPYERERREKTNSERDGSDDGSTSEKNMRGGRQNRYPVYNPRGGHRGQWDRPGNRGRGRGGSHYYDKPQRRSDSERDSHGKDERDSDRQERHEEEVQLKEERRPENAESPNNGPHQDVKKEEHSQDEADGQRVARKDRDGDSHNRKNPKNAATSKRGGSNAGNSGNQRTGNKIEGYGPPSDQKPFSNPGSKASDDESGKGKEKPGEANQHTSATKDNAIPSLMAFEISPPTMAQFKKNPREREFHPNNRTAVPPRLQRGQGPGTGPEFNERDRFQNRPKRGGKSHGGSGKKDGEETEESTDNESDNDSRKSGGTNNKPGKESGGGYQQVKKKNAPQKATHSEKNFDASVGAAPGQAARGNEKKGKQVKYPPYDARSAQSQLPPRLAKQRDSQGPPASNVPGNGSNGNAAPNKEGVTQSSKGVEPAAPPATSAWEKPIASAFRPEKAVGHNSVTSTSNQQSGEGKESTADLKVSNQAVPSAASPAVSTTATGTTVLDGTNPPAQTMIFENRNFKGGFSDVNSKSAASKLPESKKDSLNSLESVKGLASIGFGKGHGEGSPDLDFGSFEEPGNVSQAQSSVGSMMASHGPKQPTATSILQQQARHAFEHQSPISPCAAELTEKIKQVQKVWETPSMAPVHEQSGVFGGLEDSPFHNTFGSDFKSSDGSGRGDYGPSSLQQGGGGFSGGSSPSLSAIGKPESSSSPNLGNSRQPNRQGQVTTGQQQPPIAKAPGHQQTIPTPFNNYGVEQQHPIGTKNFGNIPVVTSKVMFPTNVPMSLDPFGSQYTQYQNPGAGVIPFSQGGSVMIRPVEPKSMYPTMYGQPQVSGVASQNMGGHGQNHNSVSPGPVANSGNIGSNGGNAVHMNQRSNMVSKPSQQNRNAPMNQPPPGSHHNYYHSHHNTLPQQQMHKGGFGPTNGGYSDATLSYQQQPPIIIPVENSMYNLGGNFDSSDLRSGPSGPVPPGTPPVQSSSNYYFGSNNNPCVYPPSAPSQNYGHPFGQSLKLSGFNSGSGSSDQGSNLTSQRIREHHSYMPGSIGVTGMEPLPQNPMKSGHDFVVRQQSWSHGNEFVQQMQWNPSPIQRPIYPQSTAQVMPSIVPSSHYMQGPGGPGCVGGKPQNQSNDSMGNNPG